MHKMQQYALPHPTPWSKNFGVESLCTYLVVLFVADNTLPSKGELIGLAYSQFQSEVPPFMYLLTQYYMYQRLANQDIGDDHVLYVYASPRELYSSTLQPHHTMVCSIRTKWLIVCRAWLSMLTLDGVQYLYKMKSTKVQTSPIMRAAC